VTLTLDAPTLDVTLLESRQPDVPLVCTRGGIGSDTFDPCHRIAKWEAFCFGCGHIFRRCQPHYEEDVETAADSTWRGTEWYDVCHRCAICEVKVYIQQYGRLPS
jgi:hypothetical protein